MHAIESVYGRYALRPVRNDLVTEAIDWFIEDNPTQSQRRVSNELGISRATLQRIMKELKFHPYKLQLTHELGPEDYGARLEFSLSQLRIIEQEPEFAKRILFSDEALFHLHGGVNRHNCRYWSKTNPHYVQEKPIQSPKLIVWTGICAKGIIGPYFFENTVNGERYAGKNATFAKNVLLKC